MEDRTGECPKCGVLWFERCRMMPQLFEAYCPRAIDARRFEMPPEPQHEA
jgi:hypothetical protein